MENLTNQNNGAAELCSLCGQPLTAFGSKVFQDGILCRDCAALLSPWLDDGTVAGMSQRELKRHLSYRRRNAEKLADFEPARTAEGKYSLYMDADGKRFAISKRADLKKYNADLFRTSLVRAVRVCSLPNGDEGCADVMLDMEFSRGQIKKLSFRVNEFPGLDMASEEYADALKTAEAYIKLLVESGVKQERISRENGR